VAVKAARIPFAWIVQLSLSDALRGVTAVVTLEDRLHRHQLGARKRLHYRRRSVHCRPNGSDPRTRSVP
jgi:hypothetical protein